MKKQFTFILIISILAGCSSEDPIVNKEEIEHPQTVDITASLCDGSRFIEREYEEKSTPMLGVYKTIPMQKEYSFSKEGKGTLTTYIAESTPRGYSQDITDFTWSATNKKPVTLNISLADGERIKLEDVNIQENELSYSSGTWYKELSVEKVWNSSDVEEYSADFSYYTSEGSQPPYLKCIVFSPARLSVTTSEGEVTFITSSYGVTPFTVPLPAYSKDGGPLTYYDSYIYACVDTEESYYPYSFFQIVAEIEEKPFSENGKMYFYLGKFDGIKKELDLIESNKKYVPEN